MTMQQWAQGDSSPWSKVNENFDAISHTSVYAKDVTTSSGLTWGYYGGRWGGFSVAAGTLTLTNSTANYIVAAIASGAISVSTATTNWNDSTNYARIYKVTTSGGAVSATEDHRAGPGGTGGGGGGAGGGITALTGDVTASGSGSVAATIANDATTNAKLANMAASTFKMRVTGSTGDPEDGTAAQAAGILQGDGLTVDLAGFRGIPQNAQSGNYTLVAADAGKHICHASGAGAGDTYTIPANASVAFPIGTTVTFVNMDSNAVSIAITTDTMNLSSAGTTGTRSLAQYGVATAVKVASTVWLISGSGLT